MTEQDEHTEEQDECDTCYGSLIESKQCPGCGAMYEDPLYFAYFCHFCGEKLEETECMQCNGSI